MFCSKPKFKKTLTHIDWNENITQKDKNKHGLLSIGLKRWKIYCHFFFTETDNFFFIKKMYITFNSNAALPIPDAAPDPESPTK